MIIDLSLPIRINAPGVEFEQWAHEDGAQNLSRRTRWFPGDSARKKAFNYLRWLVGLRRIRPDDLPDGCFLSNEFYRMSVHHGTHVDAPFHYGPRCEGKASKKVLDLPLEWLLGPGIILDVRDCGRVVTAEVVRSAAERCGTTLGEGSIVLFRTDADRLVGTPAYFDQATSIRPDAIDELVDRGVKVIGTDCWSFDGSPRQMVEEFYRTKNSSLLWPAHMHGRQREFLQIECLANLRSVPPGPFEFIGFPIALADAGAAWCRAVAVVRSAAATSANAVYSS
jgi:cyclase